MYIYESHEGGFYATTEELDYEFLYCEQCGDSDWLLGEADTREELLELLRDENSTEDDTDDVYGGWDPEYIEEFCRTEFEARDEEEDDENTKIH